MERKPRTRSRPVCFLPIPKCASSSVITVLRPWQNTWAFIHDYDRVARQTLAVEEVQRLHSTGWWFTFVRNPWARIVSAWQMYEQTPPFRGDKSRTLDDVVKLLADCDWGLPAPEPWPRDELANDYYLQQHLVPCSLLPLSQAAFIGQVETIKADWETVQDCTGIRVVLARNNKSQHKPYRDYFSAEQRDLVSRVYRDDIERFNYTY